MTKEEQQFNQWFDEYADGVKVFEEADMKQAYLQGRAELEEAKANLEYLLEGRDNEITELEKKNKVLAQNLEDTEIINNALEKENADLQKSYEELYNSMRIIKDQLTKAKDLLKQWLSLCGFKVEKLSKDTEQFLSEVEK